MSSRGKKTGIYSQILSMIFLEHFVPGVERIPFTRDDIENASSRLGQSLKNLGDVVYSYRYRNEMPKSISEKAPPGKAWIIIGEGDAQYAFKLCHTPFVTPNHALQRIKLPENTPEIIERYRLSDEQGLLSKVRYNRLIDTFLGITSFSLQNHLRTKVEGIGQIEIDEIYVGVNKKGQHYIIPVQAKGGRDKIGVVQLAQDITYCQKQFPDLICIPISVQFLSDHVIAMFHLSCEDYNARIVEEKHYELVPSSAISDEYIRQLKNLP